MSKNVKMIVSNTSLASVLAETRPAAKDPGNDCAGPYKVLVPVEIVFDHLTEGELSDLLKCKHQLVLHGTMKGGNTKHDLRSKSVHQQGIVIDIVQPRKQTRCFCCADLWNILNKKRDFTIYRHLI